VHKTANVLNKLPKSQQPKASGLTGDLDGETSKDAEAAFDAFIAAYELKYDKAAECLAKDRQALLAFYDFPRTLETLRTRTRSRAPLRTVRHRTIRSKGCPVEYIKTALAMVFKLVDAAQKAGAGSMATTSCPSSFKVSGSPTGSKSPPTPRPRIPNRRPVPQAITKIRR